MHHSAGAAGNDSWRCCGHELFQGQLSGAFFAGRLRTRRAHPFKNEMKRLDSAETRWVKSCRKRLSRAIRKICLPWKTPAASPICVCEFIPMEAWRACGCMEKPFRITQPARPREIDLAAVENGGSALASSDQHYGAPRNLLMPYRAQKHGRRLGNQTQARPRPRLGDPQTRRAAARFIA